MTVADRINQAIELIDMGKGDEAVARLAQAKQQLAGFEIRNEKTELYGTEIVLPVDNGMQLRADGEDPDGTSYVRVCDPQGREVAYWVYDEWVEDPQVVMGAIIGTLCVIEYGEERT